MGKVGVRVKLATHFYPADRILSFILNVIFSILYVASNYRVILKGELGSMWKENIRLERLGEGREKPNAAEIRICSIPSTKQECYDSTPMSDLPSSGKF
jgi:hypothetical protein